MSAQKIKIFYELAIIKLKITRKSFEPHDTNHFVVASVTFRNSFL